MHTDRPKYSCYLHYVVSGHENDNSVSPELVITVGLRHVLTLRRVVRCHSLVEHYCSFYMPISQKVLLFSLFI